MILLIYHSIHVIKEHILFYTRNLSFEYFVLFKFTQNEWWVGILYTVYSIQSLHRLEHKKSL